jgi:hypothetical protein
MSTNLLDRMNDAAEEDFAAPDEQGVSRLSQAAEALKTLQNRIERGKALLRELQTEEERYIREVIPGIMDDLGMMKFTLTDGSEVSVSPDLFISVLSGHERPAFEWLRENGHAGIIKHTVSVEFGKGDDEHAKEVVNALREKNLTPKDDEKIAPQTLRKWAKDQLDDGHEVPERLFKLFEFRKAKITPPKKRG